MKKTFSIIFKFSGGVNRYFVLAIAASLCGIIFQFLTPQVIRFTVDYVIGTGKSSLPAFMMRLLDSMGGRDFLRSGLYICAGGVVFCAVMNGVFSFAARMSISTFTESLIKRLRDRLFGHIQRLPFSWHVKNQTGDIIQRCTSDVEVVRNLVSNQLLQVIRTLVLVTVALILMFSMNATMSVVALIFIPIVTLYSGYFFSKIHKKFKVADEAEGDLTVTVQENLTGVRVVRAFGREQYELERFDKRNNRFGDLWIKLGGISGLYWGIGDLSTGLMILAVIVTGSILASRGALTLGEFIVFVSYSQMLAWPVRSLGRVLSDMSKSGVSAGRISEILDAEEETPEPDGLRPDMNGDIRFENVTFSYGETPVLSDLSFTVESGTTFGILGSTGSGKSTITCLLNRLYDIPNDGGSVTIGGIDIREINREYLRKNVGVVLQEPFLFSKTIQENISAAVPGASLDTIRHAASVAAVDDNITGFAEGYNTMVGERGVTLSGGQKQRVAIARTLMQHAPIMVFDDSMSAVDLETDAKIREALTRESGGATVILISHRISTLMRADKILVLEDGKRRELGSHAELMALGGIYRRIFDMQSEAAGDTFIEEVNA